MARYETSRGPVTLAARGGSADDALPSFSTLFSELPLFHDRHGRFAPQNHRFLPRFERLDKLYHDRKDWDPRLLREFDVLGRPAVFIVRESDRIATVRSSPVPGAHRGIDLRLARIGCELLHESGRVALWIYRPTVGLEGPR